MKQRLEKGLQVYVIMDGGLLLGEIERVLQKNTYSVRTFIGLTTVPEQRLFKTNEFEKAAMIWEKRYGVKQ